MRAKLLKMSLLLFAATLAAQTSTPSPDSIQIRSDLRVALVGQWVGFLEYRDYSEPATSTKRVKLPTWLTIADAESGKTLSWHYIYDDGPTKTVEENDVVTFSPAENRYQESDNGKPAQLSTVTGYETLKHGLGKLVLAGSGTDNNKPSETRVTMSITRNLIEITEETRAAGSTEAFAFRHSYTFTRAAPPTVPHP